VGKCSANLRATAFITSYDYNGMKQRFGGDPVSAVLSHLEDGTNVPTKIIDNRDGTYEVQFVPSKGGKYHLKVSIFGRPIKNFPLVFDTSYNNNPLCIYGCHGQDRHQFVQPVGLAVGKNGQVFVLDTGNGRIKVLSQNDCSNSPFEFVAHIEGHGLDNRSATGIALTVGGESLLVSNWRNKNITEVNFHGDFIRHFSHRDFVEPTYLAVNSRGEILVADNGAKSVFIFHSSGKLSRKVCASVSPSTPTTINTSSTSSTRKNQQLFGVIEALAIGPNDEIIIADSRIQILSVEGEPLREIFPEGKLKGHYGGIAFDEKGHLVATRVEKTKSFMQVFEYSSGQLKFVINSNEAKLKRPCGLATTNDFYSIVVDCGNDCIKKYRYH
jgi:tripartite motif-containing protein 2/3